MSTYICKNSTSTYCFINRTTCIQTGRGLEVECPVCGWKFNPEGTPKRATPEENQMVMDQMILYPDPGHTYFCWRPK